MEEKEPLMEIQSRCTRFLSYHHRRAPHEILTELASETDPKLKADIYGQGEIIAGFENEVARLLGKEAAVFMPSGTMSQLIALRIWSDRRKTRNIAFHPTCHLELHENKAYQLLHGLNGITVGSPNQLMTMEDLRKVAEPLGALLIELPQREIGGILHTWENLRDIVDWARKLGVPCHLDGARLWECKPFYGREYSDIASLFHSVYVSFYKGLGGIAGAILAGPSDFIAEARVWQRRHGGNLVHLYPYVLSAQRGLRERLGRMDAYHVKAKEIANVLTTLTEIEVVPNPPHTNMMHVYIRGERSNLESAALEISKETGVWLFDNLRPSRLPFYSYFELTIGDATLDLSTDEIGRIFQTLLRRGKV